MVNPSIPSTTLNILGLSYDNIRLLLFFAAILYSQREKVGPKVLGRKIR